MPKSTNFSDEEYEKIREICSISNNPGRITDLTARLDALNDAEVAATQADIERWKRIEYGTEKSKGGIKGTDFSTSRNRNHITNKVRSRLDYPKIDFADDPEAMIYGTLPVPGWRSLDASDEYSR